MAVRRITRAPRADRPDTTLVPEPRKGDILMPIAVANSPRARPYWDHFVRNAAPGHLAPIDSPLLARLCMALARADLAEERMGDAMVVLASKDPNSGWSQNPYLAIINRQTVIAAKLCSDLALSPAERNRIGTHDAPPRGDAAEGYFEP